MRFYLSLIAVLSFLVLQAQIVDDSTRNVYGPKTTLFTTEKDILNNTVAYQTLDTSIYLFERQSFVEKSGRRYQDLGNLGTALFPIFYEPPSVELQDMTHILLSHSNQLILSISTLNHLILTCLYYWAGVIETL